MERALEPLHPGEHLREEINELKLTKIRTAALLGVTRQHLDRILKGQSPITAPIAARISKLFGTTARIWLALQADYDLWHYRKDHAEELERIERVA